VYCRYHFAVDVVAGVVLTALMLPLGNALYFRFSKNER
jgi:membrane-associated phospholipid phosphatase